MAQDPKHSELVQQISAAWESAKVQFEELRDQVARAEALASKKGENDRLREGREKALRELGGAVWEQVKRGKLSLPPSLSGAAKAVEAAEKAVEVQAREISDLLEEGEVAVDRLRATRDSRGQVKSVVAVKGKKR